MKNIIISYASFTIRSKNTRARNIIGPLHDPVTWYKITHAGEQVAQWDFQNKGRSRWTGTSCIVLEVPLRSLLTSTCDFVSCDGIVQRAYLPTTSGTRGGDKSSLVLETVRACSVLIENHASLVSYITFVVCYRYKPGVLYYHGDDTEIPLMRQRSGKR